MKLSEDKIQILERLEKNTVTIIRGEAGTGKTLIGILGGQKLLNESKDWERVLFLTYSKFAKRQIIKTIHKLEEKNFLKYEYIKRMDVMNYHSFWWKLITEYHCFLGIKSTPLIYTKKELNDNTSKLIKEIPGGVIPIHFFNKDGSLNQQKKKKAEELLTGSGALYWQFGPEHFGKKGEIFFNSHKLLEWSRAKIVDRNKESFFSHEETICWAYTLLIKHPNLISLIRKKYSVFIFDEFQDTDIAQWEMIKLILPNTILVLADPAQTIHTWRGANPKRLEYLKLFCKEKGTYSRIESHTLTVTHRSLVKMSEPQNIIWVDIIAGNMRNPNEKAQFNKLKTNAKYRCKSLYFRVFREKKKIAILCLTNKITDEITDFFRTQQINREGIPTMRPLKCTRYGADYSPFEAARNIIFELLKHLESTLEEKLNKYLANEIFEEIFFHKIDFCNERSRRQDLKERWRLALKLKDSMIENLGVGLTNFKKYVTRIENRIQTSCDRIMVNTVNRVGESILRMGKDEWKSLTISEKRIKIDSVILQYEEALTIYQNDCLYIMTIHQAKGQEFDDVIIFWFSTRPWDNSNGSGWDTNDIEQMNLFHTACTRAKERVFVIRPREYQPPWPPLSFS